MSDPTKEEQPAFIFIACGPNETLYGLDGAGRVWKYILKNDRRFAFWIKLTDQRVTWEAKGE